jgi:hypothetical protein
VDATSTSDDATRAALNQSQVIDLTTTGRRTGQPRRIEIFLHHDDGRLYITGMPRAASAWVTCGPMPNRRPMSPEK